MLHTRPPAALLLALAGAIALPAQQPVRARVRFDFELTPAATTQTAQITALVPVTIAGRQTVSGVAYDPKPARVEQADGNCYAGFAWNGPQKPQHAAISADVELLPPRGHPVPQPKAARSGKDAFAPWLAAERCLDVDAAVIREAAKQLTGADDEELARAAARAVGKQLTYTGFSLDEAGAARAWQTGKGDCTEFSDTMVSLLRARGVPARHCSGWLVEWDTVPCHSWVEVWCRGKGWVLFDPSAGQKFPDRLLGSAPIYVQLSTVRNDARLQNHQLYSWSFTGGEIKVKATFTVTIDGKARSWSP